MISEPSGGKIEMAEGGEPLWSSLSHVWHLAVVMESSLRQGSAGTVSCRTCAWPLPLAWASQSMMAGSSKKARQRRGYMAISDITLDVTQHHLHPVVLVANKSPRPARIQGREIRLRPLMEE